MLLKIISALICWGAFTLAIIKIPYPETLSQANIIQLLALFIPLFVAITFTFNIFLKNIFVSGSISLGLIFLLILKSLDSLNAVTGILIIIIMYLLISYFKKKKGGSLTKWPKIPKLTRLKKKS
ncbi:hypothetical protein HYW41_04630 [Candidatus Daviesbacteria bacterium]|nr:hypothetical protein [Candidatus Daviesbacteria bacterium]